MRCNAQVMYLVRHRRCPARRQFTERSPSTYQSLPILAEQFHNGKLSGSLPASEWLQFDQDVYSIIQATAKGEVDSRLLTMTTIIVSYPSERFGQTERKYRDHLINPKPQGHQNTLPVSRAPNPQEAVQEIYRGGEAVIDRTAS